MDISDQINTLIGDVPVSEQLSIALGYLALKDHTHDNYVSINEFNALKRQFEALIALVGDTPISEQISTALKNNK
jgi:hypothetical protein